MIDFEKLREELEVYHSSKKREFDFYPIVKWIKKNLDVEKIETNKSTGKRGQGSKRFFFHYLLKKHHGDGHFTIHVSHKKKETITRFDFRKYLYHNLMDIIKYMEQETKGDNTN